MTDTTTELEPSHVFENRVRARLEEATQAATDAAAAEEIASAEVTQLRGDFKIGRIPRGPWDAASKRLSKLQNARADADAALRAVERDIARQREARHAAEVLVQRAERQAYAATRAASLARARELFDRIAEALLEIDSLEALPPLTRWANDHARAIDSLARLRRNLTS